MKKFILSLLTIMGICGSCNAQDSVKALSPKEFMEAAANDSISVLLDVRKPSEFNECHIPGAINLDWLNTEEFQKGLTNLDKNRTYYIYCRSGRRSNAAAISMQKEGFKVTDMKGGFLKYQEMLRNQ